ncbi:DUF4232 domain-containing protein [Microlunatus flavus]|uniref:DUF4232 domain-containing protein n=1 Tax=Microlunatus flavus TaxID=1036181 RepID=A0A1H9JED8_9ACTN|nr:DUF4232 domain-containing protein [Microlunatus flavus]SEQ84945.1 Protein of unknown function [Microlunatus flavus]
MTRRPPTSAAVPLALVAGAVLLTAGACGTGSDQGGAGAAPTVTVTTTATPSAAASSPDAPPATSSPRATSPSGGGSGDGTCATSALRVAYADDPGGAGAGSVNGTLTFTNTGSAPCTLRGFPGVSFVGGGNGTQVGQAATRTDDSVTTKTVKGGGSVEAALRRSQPGNYGSSCDQTKVDGFRVYPPGSTEAVFVTFPTTGCRSTSAALLQVGPVR